MRSESLDYSRANARREGRKKNRDYYKWISILITTWPCAMTDLTFLVPDYTPVIVRHLQPMTELDTPLFIPPEDEGFLVDSEEEVATARLLHSPPRKRSRNLFEKPELMRVSKHELSEIVRDEDYYLSDGSCIVLVGNTLFNVSPLVYCSNHH
jgi:hypothetical protein